MSGNLKRTGLAALLAGTFTLALGTASAQVNKCTDPSTIKITANITTSTTWTTGNEYILTNKIYVSNGATLTIEPGVVVRGEPESTPGARDIGNLAISRDSKLIALGTPDNPIIFTDCRDDNIGANPGTGSYGDLQSSLALTGNYGSLILLGRSLVAYDTAPPPGTGPNPARERQIEGLDALGELGFYGGCAEAAYYNPGLPPSQCDDGDTGSLSYISLRYGGYILGGNNEVNGLTFGGVGRGTDVSYIDVYNNKDDAFEMFGGTVNVHHLVFGNVGDDGIDYDQGWRGKAQFVLGMQGVAASEPVDKGGELDGGDTPDSSLPRTLPTLYNVTLTGLGAAKTTYTRRAPNTALHFRDNAGGRWFNSFFADFGSKTMCIESGAAANGCPTAPYPSATSWERTSANYTPDGVYYLEPDSDKELEVRNSLFWCFGGGGGVPTGDGAAYGCDTGKAHCDPGVFTTPAWDNGYLDCAAALPIRALLREDLTGAPGSADQVTAIDPRPLPTGPLASSPRTAPNDGFLKPVAYKGAFNPYNNWAHGWSTLARLGYFPTCDTVNFPDVVPEYAQGLLLSHNSATGVSTLNWSAPVGSAGGELFDVIKTSDPTDFNAGATCLSSNTLGLSTTDTGAPAPGSAFFYLIRAGNPCGEGGIGENSAGAIRTGLGC